MKLIGRYTVLAAAALLLLVGVVFGLRDDGDVSDSSSTAATDVQTESIGGGAGTAAAPLKPYLLERTRTCLRAKGFTVESIRSSDPRLRALGDLAQKTSLQVERSGRTIGIAFGNARLLESLLRVPDDPYRLEVRRNTLLMYRPGARNEAAVLRSCLRP